jgi:hypothetical protein
MNVKIFSTIIGVICLTSLTWGSVPIISLGAGSVSFSESYKSGPSFSGSLGFRAPSGVMIEGRVGYIETESNDASLEDLKMVPVLAGISYQFRSKRRLNPYLGVSAGIAFMGNGYDSNLMIFGGKVGLLYKLKGQTIFFVEAEQLNGHDDENDIDLEPFSVRTGFALMLRGNKKHKKETVYKEKETAPLRPAPYKKRRGAGRRR